MSRFIKTEDGYVNASHVVKAREGKDGVVRLIDAGGEDLGKTWADTLHRVCGTIVPAAPGTFAFIINDDAMGARPTADHVYSVFEPVIGWRIRDGYDERNSVPVLIDTPHPESGFYVIQMPTGQLFGANAEQFDNLDDAMARFLTRRQAEWDRKHAAKLAAAD